MTEPPWALLAADALRAALAGDDDLSWSLLVRIHDEFGPDALPYVILAYVDTYFLQAGLDKAGRRLGLAFREDDSGRLEYADEVPPEVAWAGRLMVARMNSDQDVVQALLESVPDGATWTRNVTALVNMVVSNLRPILGIPVEGDV